MSEWIKCSDRFPEISTDKRKSRFDWSDNVLIWWTRGDEDENFQPVPAVAIGQYSHYNNEWRPSGCMGNYNEQITHWQHLPPEPPK